MASVSRYSYTTLPSPSHVRLLELRPSPNPSTPLTASILVTDLDDDDDGFLYEALSYTWGPPVFQEKLIIYDRSGNERILMITTALASALRRFRQAGRPRNIWADAVCINQGDDVEKSTQIPLMSRIYREAVRVLVWLGDSEQIERPLVYLAGRAQKAKCNTAATSSRLKEALSTLLSSPWFGRRWIIQETVLNSDVLLCCGPSELTWSRLASIIRGSPFDGKRLDTPAAQSVLTMFDLWKFWTLGDRSDVDCGLMTLLQRFEASDCSDPRDRIYALAGLANDVTFANSHTDESISVDNESEDKTPARLVIESDYSLPAEELFTRVAESIYYRDNLHGLIWLLSQAGSRRSRPAKALDGSPCIPRIPSWVPDWPLRRTCSPLQYPLDSPLRFREEVDHQIRRLSDGRSIVTAYMRCVVTLPKNTLMFHFIQQAHLLLKESTRLGAQIPVQERSTGRLELLDIQCKSASYPSKLDFRAKRLWMAQTFVMLYGGHDNSSQTLKVRISPKNLQLQRRLSYLKCHYN